MKTKTQETDLEAFYHVLSKELKCRLISYHRLDKDAYDKHLNGMPAFTNCLLSAIDPKSDRIVSTYFVPKGSRFDQKTLADLFAKKVSFEIIFFDADVESIPVFSLLKMAPFQIHDLELFSPFWTLLRFEAIHSNFLKDFIVELTLEKMTVFILRDLASSDATVFAQLQRLFGNSRLVRLLSHIHQNITQEIDLELMGELVELSADYVSQFIKRAIGESTQAYMVDQRVQYGLYLLVTRSDDSISTIADVAGFVDQAYFNRRFKIIFGANPTKVRRQYRDLFKKVSVPQRQVGEAKKELLQ